MSIFEKYQEIALKEFGCRISKADKKSSFKELFGIDSNMAQKIGFSSCVEKFERDFFEKHKHNAVFAAGVCENEMFCFVGISDEEYTSCESDKLVLDSTSKWPYRVSCFVGLESGAVRFNEVIVPEKK